MIHPAAVVHPSAQLHPSVEVGPFAVIDEGVSLGANCRVGPHTHLTGICSAGSENVFHTGCVIGDAPQDLKYAGAPTRVVIGDKNVFREHVTIHRSSKIEGATQIGSGNLFMANSHVGHDSRIGDQVVMANGALLAGHVEVADRAFISGNCLVHQFTRIGTLSMMQGGAGIGQDLPPFTIASGVNAICGLNTVGLRRAGFTPAERLELKRLYQFLFRGGLIMREALQQAETQFSSDPSRLMLEFIRASKRGVCRHPRRFQGSEANDPDGDSSTTPPLAS